MKNTGSYEYEGEPDLSSMAIGLASAKWQKKKWAFPTEWEKIFANEGSDKGLYNL